MLWPEPESKSKKISCPEKKKKRKPANPSWKAPIWRVFSLFHRSEASCCFCFVTLECHRAWFLQCGSNTPAALPKHRTRTSHYSYFSSQWNMSAPFTVPRRGASSEGFGAEQSVPNSLGTPICLGLSQKEHPPTTSSVRDTRCKAPAAHLPRLGGECAGGRSFFPAKCTHMVLTRRNAAGSHSRGFAANVFQESSWSQNDCQSSAVCVKDSELQCPWKTDANQDPRLKMHKFSSFIFSALDCWDNFSLSKLFDQENSTTGAKKLKQLTNPFKPTKVSHISSYMSSYRFS